MSLALYIYPVQIPKVANSYNKGGELTKVAKEQIIDQNNHADNFVLSPLIWIRYQLWMVAELGFNLQDDCWISLKNKTANQSVSLA